MSILKKWNKVLISSLLFMLLIGAMNSKTKEVYAASKDSKSEYFNSSSVYLNFKDKKSTSYDFDIKAEKLKIVKSYTWYVGEDKGDPNAVLIHSRTGIVTAKKAGTAYIRCKITLKDGTILRPEAKVVVRNNITKVDISNIPKTMKIPAGESMDFNRVVLNTDAGKGMQSKGITRWEIKDDTSETGYITESGAVFPTKAGSFSVRAICFQSKEKYNLWLENKQKNEKLITASSPWYQITVKASNGEAKVSNQSELDKALISGHFTKIMLATDKEAVFSIAEGNYSDTTLFVDAPEAEIKNYAIFKLIHINAIKEDTWEENARGNSFYVTAIKLRIIVNGTAEIREITFDRGEAVIFIEQNGVVQQLTFLKPADLNLTGDGERVPITIEQTGEGSTITTSVPIKIEVTGDLNIILNSGSEGSMINKSDPSIRVKVDNNSEDQVFITTNDQNGIIVNTGESVISDISTQPQLPINLTEIRIKIPATKTVYRVGDPLDITGLLVEGSYTNYGNRIISISKSDVTGFDSSRITVGQVLTITVGGKSITYSIDIIPAQLSITEPAIVLSKVYDGNCSVEATAGTLLGVVEGQEVTVKATASYDNAYVGTGKTITLVYTIEGADAVNYIKPEEELYVTGIISAKPLVISDPEVTASKVYDGTTAATISIGDLSGVIDGDSVTVSATASYDDKNSGTGKTIRVVYSFAGEDAGQYAALEDYIITDGIISPAELSCKADLVSLTKVYDGTTVANIENYIFEGIVGDEVAVLVRADYDSAEVGTSKQITVNFDITGRESINYITPDGFTYSSAGTIEPRQLTVTGTVVTMEKVYDGNTEAEFTLGTLNNQIEGDDISFTATAAYLTPEQGENKTIQLVYSISGEAAANYRKPDDILIATGVIRKKQLYISVPTVQTEKIYNGTDTAFITKGTLSGVIASETVGVKANAYYSDKNAGSQIITVDYTLEGLDAGNYLTPESYATEGVIRQRELIARVDYSSSKTYDGTVTIQAEITDINNSIPGDDIRVRAEVYYDDPYVGTGKGINLMYSLSGGDAANYKISNSSISNGVISNKHLTISEPVLELEKEYDGNTSVIFTPGALSGLVAGDEVFISAEAAYDTAEPGTGKTIRVSYTLSGSDVDNYEKPADYVVTNGIITSYIARLRNSASIGEVEAWLAENGLKLDLSLYNALEPQCKTLTERSLFKMRANLTARDLIQQAIIACIPLRVTEVRAANGDGVYGLGGSIDINVSFSGDIRFTGNPVLYLETGRLGATAIAKSVHGNTITFTYTVGTNDNNANLDYVGISALDLKGGVIEDKDNIKGVYLALPVPGGTGSLSANNNIRIDTTPPASITISQKNIIPAKGSVVLTAVGDCLSNSSWMNILSVIQSNTNNGGNWITGISESDLKIIPSTDGTYATLQNNSTIPADIQRDFAIMKDQVIDRAGNVATSDIIIDGFIVTTIKSKGGAPYVDRTTINNTDKFITFIKVTDMTVTKLRNAVESTDGSFQSYSVIDGAGQIAEGDQIITSANRLVVTASDGVTQSIYEIRIEWSLLTIGNISVIEGDSGTRDAVFTINRIGSTILEKKVGYYIEPDSEYYLELQEGVDYTYSGHEVIFERGQSTQTIIIKIIGDTIKEDNEKLVLTLYDTSDGITVIIKRYCTIIDDD